MGIRPKRLVLALLLGLTAFGFTWGSAATIGSVSASDVGAGADAVAACDSDGIAVNYTPSYSATAPAGYKISTVTVSGVDDACDGHPLGVTLTNGAQGQVGSGSGTVPTDSTSTSYTLTLSSPASASDVSNVHVVVS